MSAATISPSVISHADRMRIDARNLRDHALRSDHRSAEFLNNVAGRMDGVYLQLAQAGEQAGASRVASAAPEPYAAYDGPALEPSGEIIWETPTQLRQRVEAAQAALDAAVQQASCRIEPYPPVRCPVSIAQAQLKEAERRQALRREQDAAERRRGPYASALFTELRSVLNPLAGGDVCPAMQQAMLRRVIPLLREGDNTLREVYEAADRGNAVFEREQLEIEPAMGNA